MKNFVRMYDKQNVKLNKLIKGITCKPKQCTTESTSLI